MPSTIEKYNASMKEASTLKRLESLSVLYPDFHYSKQTLIRDLNKYEIAGIEKLSVSSLNQFRMNSMAWALRYYIGFKSRYPKPSFSRGKAVEKTAENTRIGIGKDTPNPLFQADSLKEVFKMFKELPFNPDLAIADFAEKSPEEFIPALKDLIMNIIELSEKENIPEWLDEKTIEKILKKIAKEQEIVNNTYSYVRDYICSLSDLKAQQRIELSSIFGLPVGFIGFSDWETPDYGIDLKTLTRFADIPEDWSKTKVAHKCQISAYSVITGKPFSLVYVAPISKKAIEDVNKEKIIYDIWKHLPDVKLIVKQFKELTGSGTTAPTVEKFIHKFIHPDYEFPQIPEPLKVIELPSMDEAVKYHKFNEATAKAIHRVITSCRKDSFEEDLLTHCISDPDNMMLDPDEKRKIQELWGISFDESEGEEND